MITFRVVTYNIHRSRGMDWRVRPDRIARVLELIRADVIALQEVVGDQVEYLAREVGMPYVFGPATKLHGHDYGNLVFSRFPMTGSENYDITVERREGRRCLRVDLELKSGTDVHLFAVHLGTSYFERRQQAAKLISEAVLNMSHRSGPRIIIGDFNEWTRGLVSRVLGEQMESANTRLHLGRGRTYPGLIPFLHLDHVYYDEPLRLAAMHLFRSRSALMASDHLPLLAQFELD